LIAGPGGVLDDEAREIEGLGFETCSSLVRPISPRADLEALRDLTRRLRRLAPHVVHTHSSKAGILGRWAARIAGVPVVIHTVHGWGFHAHQAPWKRWTFIALERAVRRHTTRLVAVSKANVEAGVDRRIARREEFEVIYSGVALEPYRRAAGNGMLRRELGLAPETPLAGMVACLKPQKAPVDFVEVAASVSKDRPDAHFVLAGDGELREEVERAVIAHGLQGRFHLLGWRRDVPEVIGDLDVLVLTSLHEGLPRVFPEAMAAGRPIVATAVDGGPEAVHHGRNGFLHPVRDVEGMARSLSTLLSDADLRRRMGEEGRPRAEAWDIDLMVRKQEELYLSEIAKCVGLEEAPNR